MLNMQCCLKLKITCYARRSETMRWDNCFVVLPETCWLSIRVARWLSEKTPDISYTPNCHKWLLADSSLSSGGSDYRACPSWIRPWSGDNNACHPLVATSFLRSPEHIKVVWWPSDIIALATVALYLRISTSRTQISALTWLGCSVLAPMAWWHIDVVKNNWEIPGPIYCQALKRTFSLEASMRNQFCGNLELIRDKHHEIVNETWRLHVSAALGLGLV